MSTFNIMQLHYINMQLFTTIYNYLQKNNSYTTSIYKE